MRRERKYAGGSREGISKMVNPAYVGYTIAIFIILGFLISLMPVKGEGKNEKDNQDHQNDKGV